MKFRSDHPRDFDFVVYGAGFSGVGAALELGRSGYRVGIIETAGEVPIRGTNLVLPTPLNQSVDSGPNIDESIDTLLFPKNNIWPFVDRGECLQVDDAVVVGHDPFTGKNIWTAKHLVFAHPGQCRPFHGVNGAQPALAARQGRAAVGVLEGLGELM